MNPDPTRTQRPERRFTPEEMRRLMEAGQVGGTSPRPPTRQPMPTAKPLPPPDPLQSDLQEPDEEVLDAEEVDATNRGYVEDLCKQLVADFSPRIPRIEALIADRKDGTFGIEVATASMTDALQLDWMLGGWYGGVPVAVFELDIPEPPRWTLEEYTRAARLAASGRDGPPEPETPAPKAKRKPRIDTVPQQRRRPLRNDTWRKRT